MFPNRRIETRTRRSPSILAWGSLALGLVVAAAAAGFTLRPDGPAAAGAADDDAIASVAVLLPDDRLDPRILALELTGRTWRDAVAGFDAAMFAVNDNARRLRVAQARLADLSAERDEVVRSYDDVTAEIAALDADLAEVERALAQQALDRFMGFGSDDLAGLSDPSRATEADRAVELARRAEEVQLATRAELLALQQSSARAQLDLVARRIELDAEIASTAEVIAQRQGDVPDLLAALDAAAATVRRARWSATVPGTDLSVVALDAYLNAEDLLREVWPSCNIGWWMMAGVARIESWHGRYGGRTLRADGRVDRPIIGIALDGGPGVRAIADTDDGVYDGDDVWDRAVGPLQFIPETWRSRGRDANADGWADPQNIYDAAYSAGRYLCALGGDLSSRGNLRRAYFGYNNSTKYVNDVIRHADRYAAFELPAPPGDAPPDPVSAPGRRDLASTAAVENAD